MHVIFTVNICTCTDVLTVIERSFYSLYLPTRLTRSEQDDCQLAWEPVEDIWLAWLPSTPADSRTCGDERTGYLWACPVKVTCDCSLWTFSEAKGSHWQRSFSLQLVCMKYRGYTYKWHKLLRNNMQYVPKFTLVPYLENKDFLSTSRSESLTDALYCTSGWSRKIILSVLQKIALPPPSPIAL